MNVGRTRERRGKEERMMRTRGWVLGVAVLALAALAVSPAEARIKLVALPERGETIVRLDNPAATLIEEERVLTLQKGLNKVDFSWKGVSIDADSIRLRVLDHPDKVTLLSVSYPPNEAALVWQVASSGSGSARVRISYLLGNLSKSFNYRAVASNDERTLTLRQYMRLQNFANEEFGSTGLWAGFGTRFLKPIGINETKEMLMEKYEKVPVRKTYTSDPTAFGY